MSREKEWWEPVLTDHWYCQRIREDYPERTIGMTDEHIVSEFNEGRRYQTLWDHTGDAYDQFKELADDWRRLKLKAGEEL